VAVVEQVGFAVSELELSPFTKPEYEAVTVGTLPPYVIVAEEAVTVRLAGLIFTAPATYTMV
jgi:hypothetical protein